MKTLFYSIKNFEQAPLFAANKYRLEIAFTNKALGIGTADMAKGYDAVCIFAGDDASAPVIEQLAAQGVKYIAVRATGVDNVALDKTAECGITVANVPAYSPYAIAEHAAGLLLALNRKLITANSQVHRGDFRVDGLVGFDLHGKTVGIIGTGKIGSAFARIMHGFGCRLLGYDIYPDAALEKECSLEYTSLEQLCRQSCIISLHTGLTPETKYLINSDNIRLFKRGTMLINTGRGGCVNTEDVIEGLENGQIGCYGADVYEKEKGIFFYDRSNEGFYDNTLSRLLSFPNVLLTPHQAFATTEALNTIASVTFYNLDCWEKQRLCKNEVSRDLHHIS